MSLRPHNFTFVIPCVYDGIEPWTDSYFKVRIHGEGIGIISVNNGIVLQCEYDKIGAVLEGTDYFVVKKNGTEGLIDVRSYL